MKKSLFITVAMVAFAMGANAQVNNTVEAGNYKLHIIPSGNEAAIVVEGNDAVAVINGNGDATRLAQSTEKPVTLRIDNFQPQGEQVKAGDTVVKDGLIFNFPQEKTIVIGGKFYYSDEVPQTGDLSALAIASASEIEAKLAAAQVAKKRGSLYYINSKGECETASELNDVIKSLKDIKKQHK